MNLTWRFYLGPDHEWRWQVLAFDQTVVEASEGGYKEYESCLANAEQHGYHFSPSQSTRPAQDLPRKQRKSYQFSKKLDKEQPAENRDVTQTAVGETKAVSEVS